MSNVQFVPTTRNRYPVLASGQASFTVSGFEPTQSKENKTPMIKLTLDCVDHKGTKGKVFDHLVCTEKASWRIADFLDAIGKGELYATGNINSEQVMGAQGHCSLLTEKSEKSSTGHRTDVKHYLIPEGQAQDPSTHTNQDSAQSVEASQAEAITTASSESGVHHV